MKRVELKDFKAGTTYSLQDPSEEVYYKSAVQGGCVGDTYHKLSTRFGGYIQITHELSSMYKVECMRRLRCEQCY